MRARFRGLSGDFTVVDTPLGGLRVDHSDQHVLVHRNDRRALLVALMHVEGVEPGVIALVATGRETEITVDDLIADAGCVPREPREPTAAELRRASEPIDRLEGRGGLCTAYNLVSGGRARCERPIGHPGNCRATLVRVDHGLSMTGRWLWRRDGVVLHDGVNNQWRTIGRQMLSNSVQTEEIGVTREDLEFLSPDGRCTFYDWQHRCEREAGHAGDCVATWGDGRASVWDKRAPLPRVS